jgi:hypothetical protein
VPGADPVALDAERKIGPQPDRLARAARVGGMPTVLGQRPLGGRPAIVERRLADQLDFDGAVQAADRTHQQVIGVVVGRRTGVWGDLVLPFPRTHRQSIADQEPAPRRLPRRGEDVRPGLVDARGRVVDPERSEPEVARLAVEQGAEHAGRVEARDAEPIDRSVGRDQGTGVAVGQERIVRNRRERRRGGSALLLCLPRCPRAHCPTHGSCQPPLGAVSSSAADGPHEPGA